VPGVYLRAHSVATFADKIKLPYLTDLSSVIKEELPEVHPDPTIFPENQKVVQNLWKEEKTSPSEKKLSHLGKLSPTILEETEPDFCQKATNHDQSNHFKTFIEETENEQSTIEHDLQNLRPPTIFADEINPLSEIVKENEQTNSTEEQNQDIYYSVENYVDSAGDGVSLIKGQRVSVISKDERTNWWYVKLDNSKEGWAPGLYLVVNDF
jgi:hypothetical protein